MKNILHTTRIRPILKALSLIGFLALNQPSYAITITWDGGAGDDNWNSPNNWNPNQVPTASDDVYLNGAAINLNVSNITVQNLEIGTGLSFLNGTTNINITQNFTMGFAVIDITGNISVGQNIYWSAGNIVGTGTVSVTDSIIFKPYSGFSGQCYTRKAITAMHGNWTSGTLLMDNGGSMTFNGNFTANVSGSIQGFQASNGIFTVNGMFIIASTIGVSMTVGTFNNNGIIQLMSSSSTLTVNSPTFNNSGSIQGVGTLNPNSSTFNHTGSLSPGFTSPGKLTLGRLPAGTATSFIKLQGTGVAGLNYDQIAVSGDGVVSGVLDLDFLSGFVPSVGNTFVIMTCNPCSGSFTDIQSPLGNASNWQVNVGATEVTLVLNVTFPVELLEFNGRITEAGTHLLSWRTASENNNRGFFIERAQDMTHWQERGFVPGSGTSSSPQAYTFQDLEFHNGINYYRLRQQDFNGNTTYSNIVALNNKDTERVLHLWPNPAASTLQIEGPDLTDATLSILDVTGRIVIEQPYEKTQLDISSLNSGFYYLLVKNGERSFLNRFMRR